MKHLKTMRALTGRSQFWLEEASGVERSRLSLIENRHIIPTAKERAAIERALLKAMSTNLAEFRRLSGAEIA